MTFVFATPLAGLAALAGLLPVAVALVRSRQARRLRRELALPEPTVRSRLGRPLALGCAFGLLGLAAAQPSLASQHERLVRTDAQMLVVLDTSRSMLASLRPNTAARYQRAAAFASRLHAELPELPAGLASLNNRLLPYLFPTVDEQAFEVVLAHAYAIQRPAPAIDPNPRATSFDQLSQVASSTFFAPRAPKHVLLVLSDAETRPFNAAQTLRKLRRVRTTPIVVRVWHPGERIFRPGRSTEGYHSTQADELARLRAAGWSAFSEDELGAVVHRIRVVIGPGPRAAVGYRRRETSIAPMIALAVLAPLLFVVLAGRMPSLRRRDLRSAPEATAAN
jgi:hypothetical protein